MVRQHGCVQPAKPTLLARIMMTRMVSAAADFTHDVAPPHGLFTPQLLSLIVNNLHTHSPTISFTPLVYLPRQTFLF